MTSQEWEGHPSLLVWLQPAIAAPVIVALLILVSYERFVAIPRLQSEAQAARTTQPADFISLAGANSRREGAKVFQVHRYRPTVLEVDIPTTADFSSYICVLQNASGMIIYTTSVSAADAKDTVHVVLPAGSRDAGQYTLVILGEPSSAYNAPTRRETARLAFSVEVLP